jgi:hypothetical protein
MPHQLNPLPSWQAGPTRDAILQFIQRVTREGDGFVPIAQRIAVFDHDGTLWVEKPMVTELVFISDLLRHQPAQTITTGSSFCSGIFGKHLGCFLSYLRHWFALMMRQLLSDSRWLLREFIDGISTDEYQHWAKDWLKVAKHPRFNRLYPELVYQPMLEVLALFEQHGFKNYLVSGGSNYFIRAMSEHSYQIPVEQAIGSQLLTRVSEHHGRLQVELKPVPWFLDNGSGKVLAIESRIDRQPIAAFGNSSGDIQMLRWTGQYPGALCMLVHHTDAVREYQYGPGQKTLTAAANFGWHLIDMKDDWLRVFPATPDDEVD